MPLAAQGQTVTISADQFNELTNNSQTAMLLTLGPEGAKVDLEPRLRQEPKKFPLTTKCVHCEAKAKLILVGKERRRLPGEERLKYVCQLYAKEGQTYGFGSRDDDTFWVRDAIAIAVYICPECVKLTAIGDGSYAFPKDKEIKESKERNAERERRRKDFAKKQKSKKK